MHDLENCESGTFLFVGGIDEIRTIARRLICGTCQKQQALWEAGTHPDFQWVVPEAHAQWLKIDRIRALMAWANGKPQYAIRQVAVIAKAHALNPQAANALLKSLEEPAVGTLFILVTDRPKMLPATIRSRCCVIKGRAKCALTKDATALHREALIQRDLAALRAGTQEPVALAESWLKQDPIVLADLLWLTAHEQMKDHVKRGRLITDRGFWEYWDQIIAGRRDLAAPNQPNVQLLLESLLIQYAALKV